MSERSDEPKPTPESAKTPEQLHQDRLKGIFLGISEAVQNRPDALVEELPAAPYGPEAPHSFQIDLREGLDAALGLNPEISHIVEARVMYSDQHFDPSLHHETDPPQIHIDVNLHESWPMPTDKYVMYVITQKENDTAGASEPHTYAANVWVEDRDPERDAAIAEIPDAIHADDEATDIALRSLGNGSNHRIPRLSDSTPELEVAAVQFAQLGLHDITSADVAHLRVLEGVKAIIKA